MAEKRRKSSAEATGGSHIGLRLLRLSEKLPLPVTRKIGALLGLLFYAVNRKRRNIARTNIALCFPELGERARRRILIDSYKAYGQGIMDLSYLWWGSDEKFHRMLEFEGLEHVQPLLDENAPIIYVTSHKPGTDFGGVGISTLNPAISMMKPVKDPEINRLLIKGRTRFGGRMVMRDQGLRPVIQSMRREKRAFYYIPDEDFGAEETVFAPFFGIQRATLPTLGRLAKITRATVVPAFAHITPTGYKVIFDKPLTQLPGPTAEDDAARLNAVVESDIRRAPDQYLWTLKWFKTRPEGERDFYRE